MKAGFEKLAGELLERLHAAGADAEVMEAVRERDRLREELAARQHQYELIGFTTPSYVEEWLSTRDPALLPLMAYHGNHRVAVFTLKDGAELANRGESPQFKGTMVEPQVGDVIRRPDVPTLPVAVNDRSGRRQALAESILRRYPLAWEEYCNRAAAPAPEVQEQCSYASQIAQGTGLHSGIVAAFVTTGELKPAPQPAEVGGGEREALAAEVVRSRAECDAIAELNHAQFLTIEKLSTLVAAWNHIVAAAEECETDDGMAVTIQLDYWHGFTDALDAMGAELVASQPAQEVQP